MSYRVEDQMADTWDKDDVCFADGAPGHLMVSIKVDSPAVPYVERCEVCGFIEAYSLTLHAESWVKQVLPRRAQRIAVAVETNPFQFVQPPSGDLELVEILTQAFAAVSVAGDLLPQRAPVILKATLAEVDRLIYKGAMES